jgi:hypothetical protein
MPRKKKTPAESISLAQARKNAERAHQETIDRARQLITAGTQARQQQIVRTEIARTAAENLARQILLNNGLPSGFIDQAGSSAVMNNSTTNRPPEIEWVEAYNSLSGEVRYTVKWSDETEPLANISLPRLEHHLYRETQRHGLSPLARALHSLVPFRNCPLPAHVDRDGHVTISQRGFISENRSISGFDASQTIIDDPFTHGVNRSERTIQAGEPVIFDFGPGRDRTAVFISPAYDRADPKEPGAKEYNASIEAQETEEREKRSRWKNVDW